MVEEATTEFAVSIGDHLEERISMTSPRLDVDMGVIREAEEAEGGVAGGYGRQARQGT